MNKTKTVFITTFLVIIVFMLILSFYFTRAKGKKLDYLYGLGQPISRSTNEEPKNAAIEIRFSKDDSKIISLLNNGRIEQWDLDKKSRTLIAQTEGLFSFCAAENLLVISENKNVNVIDLVSNSKKLLTSGEYELASVDKDCTTVAVGGATKVIEVWDIQTGSLKSKFKTTLAPRNGLAISPDGKRVAAAEGIYHEDKRMHETLIEVWDVYSGKKEPVLSFDKRETGLIVGVWNINFHLTAVNFYLIRRLKQSLVLCL